MSNSPFSSLTSSPWPQSINLPAPESFAPSLPSPLSNPTYNSKLNSPSYSLTSSPQPWSVASSAGSPVPETTDDQACTATILNICHNAGCSDELIQQAKCKTGKELAKGPNKGTLTRILNHLAMVKVLTTMEYSSTATDPIQVKYYYHGTPLTGSQLISAFSWSINSIKHKSSWFSWAEHTAWNMHWNPQKLSEGKVYCPPCSSDPA